MRISTAGQLFGQESKEGAQMSKLKLMLILSSVMTVYVYLSLLDATGTLVSYHQ